MNIHEYQGKQLLIEYDLPVSKGYVISSPKDVITACKNIGGNSWVVKTQIHAGGRGKSGGIKLVNNYNEAKNFSEMWLGKRLLTYQTEKGQLVNKILIESYTKIIKELYISAIIDRSIKRIVFIASSEGGVEIEKIAKENPKKIIKTTIDPILGAMPYQAINIAFKLGLNKIQIKQFTKIFINLLKMFKDNDLYFIEINPLVITNKGNLHCLDIKMSIDPNALYRHHDLYSMLDISQEDEREANAKNFDLNYVALNGNIGCIVNGAGLAMGTMDMIQFNGGKPANFLDVGGSANNERVVEAFKIILSDKSVKAVLVNIFGGIVRCDMIAEGIISAINKIIIDIPVVVRLQGNNYEKGMKKLRESKLNNIIPEYNLLEAAKKVIKAAT
ncbi:Succinyl-CoA ligase [ADP-forming] subunit beta [Candidatus Johnevansia muelleri]|uniref:Succinate--CoA ligase [ADP-forming] subunit beta n=1 Tax=Candidatus Johnevansia muelleri TaxID=1495769 RepID=A0A078KDX5_9GAMM|nr:Succinyl-CoA ligase [ADP-forming] subunit beta [Candidatus Evansia muelleri]